MKKIFSYIEKNKKIKTWEILSIILILLFSYMIIKNSVSTLKFNSKIDHFVCSNEYITDLTQYEYEDSKVCPVTYSYDGVSIVVNYSSKDFNNLKTNKIIGYKFQTTSGLYLAFNTDNPSLEQIKEATIDALSYKIVPLFNLGISLIIIAISIFIIFFFSKAFNKYEKIWFITIMILASIFSCVFPEESANGVNGIIIMMLYLLDTFLNILCELLISKQSRINFLVSILVEVTEIMICVILMYRFATMASTLFFWLPIDIISFINWSKHKDDQQEEITIVRKLKGYQELLIIVGIIIWTLLVGFILSGLDISSDFIKDKNLETLIVYLDACASAVGIANGLFIFFRLQEQWIAWYVCAILETIMNILAGQYVLLILKLGYITNTTYGYIKWNKYIKNHKDDKQSLF